MVDVLVMVEVAVTDVAVVMVVVAETTLVPVAVLLSGSAEGTLESVQEGAHAVAVAVTLYGDVAVKLKVVEGVTVAWLVTGVSRHEQTLPMNCGSDFVKLAKWIIASRLGLSGSPVFLISLSVTVGMV
jgi:hypothetical protein